MGDKCLGHEGFVTLSGTNAPLSGRICQWGQSIVYPLVNVTPSGATRLQGKSYQQSLREGDGIWFDVMIDKTGTVDMGLAAGVIPSGNLTFVGNADTGHTWTGTIILETATHMNLTTDAHTRQVIRYRGKWNGALQVVAAG